MRFKIETILNKYIVVLALLFFNLSGSLSAQSIGAPANDFAQICAGAATAFPAAPAPRRR